MRIGRGWLAMMAAAGLTLGIACGDAEDDEGSSNGQTPPPTQTGQPVSFATNVHPILTNKCGTCHGQAWGNATVATAYTSAAAEVTPGNPATSNLLVKGNGGGGHGGGDQLTDTESTTVQTWIQEGAQNN